MRKRNLVAGLALAATIWLVRSPLSVFDESGSMTRDRSPSIRSGRIGLRGAALAEAAGAAPMPVHDERVAAFLAERPLDASLRAGLVDLARLQRITYAPRDPDEPTTAEQIAAHREGRVEFRKRVRDLVAAMPPETRAAMRRNNVNLVRLAQTVEAEGVTP